MRYRKKIPALFIIVLMFLGAGCGSDGKGTVTGTNYYYPEKQTESESEKQMETAVKAELGAEYYMIMENDMTMQYMILKQMKSGKEYLFYYSLTTGFLDKYGNHTSVSSFEPGRIITVGDKDMTGRLKTAQIADAVWEYEAVARFEIDEERGVFQIADTKYSFGKDLFVVSAGEQIKISDIKKEDELRVIGRNKEILSVSVTTGQGIIALKNTELFEGSFIQIGSKIFAEITGEMQIDVPEGIHMVTVANKGYGGSMEYEVIRGEVTEIDLDELKGDGPKMGMITFKIETTDKNTDADITFKLDGKEVAYKDPVELTYGIHSIAAEAFGYASYSKKLFVNSETATITIALDKETSSSASESTSDTEKESTGTSDTNTNLAGSLAGSISNSQNTDNNTSTDGLAEVLQEVLGNNSSTDYLSTLTELLGGIM